jgi:hypothetical protein
MNGAPNRPWLIDVDPDQKGMPYAAWKAERLNKLFELYGRMRERSKILPSTVQHGLDKSRANEKNGAGINDNPRADAKKATERESSLAEKFSHIKHSDCGMPPVSGAHNRL